jgi:xanthine dehydrogenase YagR molybdenum-binding subunit
MTEFPTGAQIIAENRGGQIGRGVDRVDGLSKVMGLARYSADIDEAGPVLYGVMVTARVGRGRVTVVDTAKAEAAPGVELVLSHENMPKQAKFGEHGDGGMFTAAKPVMDSADLRAFGVPIALVVADSFENAAGAAALIRADYDGERGAFDFDGAEADVEHVAEVTKGDFEAAFEAADVSFEADYATPAHNHMQMEPHASTAVWEGDKLTVYTAIQGLKGAQRSLASTLGLDRHQVRIVSRFIGGGFGGKAHVGPDAVLAAVAAKVTGRPVRVAMTRRQMFHLSTHRSATRQTIKLGAAADGTITALSHTGLMHCARYYQFTENVSALTRALYNPANLITRHSLVRLDAPMACAVRAPGGAVGTMAIEAAIDELADKLDVDPIELRLKNEPARDENGREFASRSHAQCLREGAARFGWSARKAGPGQVSDGRWLVGIGVGSAVWHTLLMPAYAAAELTAEGRVVVRQAMTDIGTGTYTILAQIAAEALGVRAEEVTVEIGDSAFPAAPGSGGSFGAATSGSAVLDAAMNLRRQIALLAVGDETSPLYGAAAEEAVFAEGGVLIGNRAVSLADIAARAPTPLRAEGRNEVPADYQKKARYAYGANFAEVGVDTLTGEVRIRRMLGVFSAGRILNEKTARSQALGGMIWGAGAALMEENHLDARTGAFANQDLGGYLIPAHADIANFEAAFIDESADDNILGIKGVGELGICGAGAAIANAVYNACGVRVRDYPITPDKLLAGLG